MKNYLVAQDKANFIAVAADFILQKIKSTTKNKEYFNLVLSGGSTPKDIFRAIVEHPDVSTIPWQKVRFFWGDERAVPPNHEDSNYKMAFEILLAPLSIPQESLFRIQAELPPPEAAHNYEITIKEILGTTPKFDLILLGMGNDGHTASLFPNSKALEIQEKLVVENWVTEQDAWRITFTPEIINQARHVAFLVSGDNKASALKKVLEGDYEPLIYPSQLIKPNNGTLTWLLDKAAAHNLSSKI